MSTVILKPCTVPVAFGLAGDRINAAGLTADFSYGADLVAITCEAPAKESVALSLVSVGREIAGSEVVVLAVTELMQPFGIRPGGPFELFALAQHKPELVGMQPVIAVRDRLDFTRDPNFPREYYPYLERKDGKVVLGMIQDSKYRVYRDGWIFLGSPGTGQPALPDA